MSGSEIKSPGTDAQVSTSGTQPRPVRAFIGLGSNMGDRAAYLSEARRALDDRPCIALTAVSSLYETEPVGYTDQGWFLNQVVEVVTGLDAYGLLQVLQEIEQDLGRQRLTRWGPRVIDLDLLLFGDEVLTDPVLTVPHPCIYERSFVLMPLNEIAPEHVHPDGRTTLEHLQALGAGQKIRLYG
jgi:2-amino-4-hydroxy-6-hydroxymethyldihydropteridine diphosphokinase